jgi:hypothetical protein
MALYEFFLPLFDLTSDFLMFLLPLEMLELLYLANFKDEPRFSGIEAT